MIKIEPIYLNKFDLLFSVASTTPSISSIIEVLSLLFNGFKDVLCKFLLLYKSLCNFLCINNPVGTY